MKREIKFRGLRSSGKGWTEGYLLRTWEGYCYLFAGNVEDIATCYMNLVNADTLGQYAGLKDKNGKEIYEGDILKVDFNREGGHESLQVVEFYEGAFGSRNTDDHFRIPALFSGRATEGMDLNYYEVVGNIHENPELIP